MDKTSKRINKKDIVIEELFNICIEKNDFIFHNNLVKDICKQHGFGNPFDVTKLDNKNKLPKQLMNNDYAIIHLGNGNHKFIKGIKKIYHEFEPIQVEIDWEYKKSILNQYNSSERKYIGYEINQEYINLAEERLMPCLL